MRLKVPEFHLPVLPSRSQESFVAKARRRNADFVESKAGSPLINLDYRQDTGYYRAFRGKKVVASWIERLGKPHTGSSSMTDLLTKIEPRAYELEQLVLGTSRRSIS